MHSLLYDLDEHVAMMDLAGIDAAWLTSAAGMCADLETSRLVNDKAKKAERDYPGRFIGAAHAHPLGGAAAFKELARCRHELGFQGVTICSEFDGKWIDDPAIEPFWNELKSSACSCSCIRRSSSIRRSHSTPTTPRAASAVNSP